MKRKSGLSPEEILKKAVEVIEERGWCQGVLEDADGRVCALGALRTAAFGHPRAVSSRYIRSYDDAALLLLRQIQAEYGPFYGITDTNDRLITTKEDMIGLFDRAIESAREEG